jgi:hypothetical protein
MDVRSSAHIGTIIRNAVTFDIKRWTGDTVSSDSLIQAVQDLFSLLEARQVDYVLVGGIALLHYVEGRNTQDLDLLMAPASLERLPELEMIHRDMYFAWASYSGLQIDLLLTHNPLFSKVYSAYAQTVRYLDREVSIATVEGLLVLKLYALPSLYRQGNFARAGIQENDIATLLYYYQPDISQVLHELAEYVSESHLAEIRNIVHDLQQRTKRFRNRESH